MTAEEYEHLEARVAELEQRTAHMLPAEIAGVSYGVSLVHEDTQAIRAELRGVNQRLDRHAAQLGGINERLDQHGERLDSIDGRLDQHDQRFDDLDNRLDRHGEMLTEILRRLPPSSDT